MRDVHEALSRLRLSPFRSRFRLKEKELEYLQGKGIEEVLKHAADFIEKRLAPAPAKEQGCIAAVIGAWLSQQEEMAE